MEEGQEDLRERCRTVSMGMFTCGCTVGAMLRATRKPKGLNIYKRCLEKEKKQRDRK